MSLRDRCSAKLTSLSLFSETIFPWVHDTSNHMRPEDMLRPILIPDVHPGREILTNRENAPGFSMVAGEFLRAYEGQSRT